MNFAKSMIFYFFIFDIIQNFEMCCPCNLGKKYMYLSHFVSFLCIVLSSCSQTVRSDAKCQM